MSKICDEFQRNYAGEGYKLQHLNDIGVPGFYKRLGEKIEEDNRDNSIIRERVRCTIEVPKTMASCLGELCCQLKQAEA